MRGLGAFLGFAAIMATCSIVSAAPAKPENPVDFLTLGSTGQNWVAGNNRFGFDLYARLMSDKGNLFLSPYSISTALAMTYAGAKADTESQMAKVLHFDMAQDKLHPAFAALIKDFNGRDKKSCELSVANALWAQNGYTFRKEYFDLVTTNYQAGLQNVDFENATEQARKTINAWVEKNTNDKIKELIKPGVLDSLTRLVLTNAIYFKGAWATPFPKGATENRPFTLADGTKADIPMMFELVSVLYAEGDGFQMVELPYRGNDLVMDLFLPRQADGLAALEKKLTADHATPWSKPPGMQQVHVYLPRFKMTSEFSLGGTLKAMGMTDAFVFGKADFSAMAGNHELFIGAVVHKAFVDVNEEGTEAAAATGLEMKATAMPVERERIDFRADHPFFFVIRDLESGSILFMGRLADPRI